MTDDVVGYAEAMAELEGILDELESDDLDVDLLADHVKRERAHRAVPLPDRAVHRRTSIRSSSTSSRSRSPTAAARAIDAGRRR